MTDQHRAECLCCAGHPHVQTPHLDRLASGGTRFSNAYSSSPVCMPARASFMTGLYPHNHRQWINGGRFDDRLETYPQHIGRQGYHTCHIGKSHMYAHGQELHMKEMLPFMRGLGWDDVLETTGPLATQRCRSIMTDRWERLGCYQTFLQDYKRRSEVGYAKATWPSPLPAGETMDDFVGRTACEYIESYDQDSPLLLFVGFGGPHSPWDPPEKWAQMYDPADMDEAKPPAEPGPWVPEPAARHQRQLEDEDLGISPEENRKIRALYYAKISHIDSWIGRILDSLETQAMLDDSTVIFWSDHGEMLGDHGRLHKSVFYEEAARIPLIIRPAHSDRNAAVSDRLVSQIDCIPTILQTAGCSGQMQQFGRSLMPLLTDPEAEHRQAVFSEVQRRTMIRTEQYKMVLNDGGVALKLYDMHQDRAEEHNLVGREESLPVVDALRDRTLNWLLRTQLRIPHTK